MRMTRFLVDIVLVLIMSVIGALTVGAGIVLLAGVLNGQTSQATEETAPPEIQVAYSIYAMHPSVAAFFGIKGPTQAGVWIYLKTSNPQAAVYEVVLKYTLGGSTEVQTGTAYVKGVPGQWASYIFWVGTTANVPHFKSVDVTTYSTLMSVTVEGDGK